MGTQKFAQLIQYDTQFLGTPLLQVGTTTLYAPWKLLTWYGMYRVYVPGLFKDVMMYPIGGLILFFYLTRHLSPAKTAYQSWQRSLGRIQRPGAYGPHFRLRRCRRPLRQHPDQAGNGLAPVPGK